MNFLGNTELNIVVGMQNNGGFVVAYRSQIPLFNGVWYRVYDSNGSPTGLAQAVATGTQYVQPSISVGSDDSFAVTYEGNDADTNGVFMRVYSAEGTAMLSQTAINQSTVDAQGWASVAAMNSGNIVVVWSGTGDQAGEADSAQGVFARQFRFRRPRIRP